MRKILVGFTGLMSVAFATLAQVTAEIQLDQEQFLRNESVPLRVRISNFSGQTLRLGTEPDWLQFNVDNRDGRLLLKTHETPITQPLELESSKTATLRADAMSYFDLNEPGHYTVTVKAKFPQIEKELTSEPKGFDILSGTTLWEREFGLPSTTIPEVRKYTLQQATFAKQLRLYVRLTDQNETKVFRVLPLGILLSFSNAEAQVDKLSHLHVLFQNGARSFLFSIVTPDGDQIIRQTYDIVSDSRPRLRVEADGRIVVAGGQRRILLSDLPPPRVALTNETSGAR